MWMRRGAGWQPYCGVCAGGCCETLKNELEGLKLADAWVEIGCAWAEVTCCDADANDCDAGTVYSESLVKLNCDGCEWM